MSDFTADFGRTADDYARHRAGFPPELVDRLAALGVERAGSRVCDLGTGTGSLGRLFALRSCEVTGVDIAAPLLEQARRLDREAGVETTYVKAPAEATGLPDGAFDIVSAGQCWHWFDRPVAAREVRRLLVAGGAIVIAHFDWLPAPGGVVAASEELILRYTPSWPFADSAGIYPQWLVDLPDAGFIGIETFSFDISVPYSRQAWIGRLRASAPISGTLGPEEVRRFCGEIEAMLEERFPDDPLVAPHRVWAVVARAGSARA
ncbi:MAG TPA: class I SAM-dependent methyltransferase [Solirubrobacterales bacterium]